MGKVKRMDQVKLIIETYLLTRSIKATSRRLDISKNTVRHYIRLGQLRNKDLSQLLLLPNHELMDIFYSLDDKQVSAREEVFKGKIDYWIKELRRVGVTRSLLWEEYKKEHPDGYGYSQFCERLKREIGRRDLTLSLDHVPGEVMQVDFAGKKMRWVDIKTAEVHECEMLVAVLPHSQYTFVIALPSQKVGDFIYGLNQAFMFFEKLPKVILSDNLKSYVTKADRYDPAFNELCVQLAAHYQIDLQATRVRKPKDKASVEGMVKTSYTRIYAPLRNDIFHSIAELNEAIRSELLIHNSKPFQKKVGSRKEIFIEFEYPVMTNLPSDLFEVKKVTKAKVQRNYHIFLGEEKNYYSVPFQYTGEQTLVFYTSSVVEIYLNNQRIAIHKRLSSRNTYLHQTKEEHMPKSHQEWKKSRGYDAAYFLAEAEKIGPATRWAISHILVSRIHEPQSYNSCRGVLSLAKKYSCERLEQAALRCQKVEKTSYSMLKRILSHNLDHIQEQVNYQTSGTHENIRGPENYQ